MWGLFGLAVEGAASQTPGRAAVSGPMWAAPGLGFRSGRYPLSVEAAVMAMVDRLVPGVSTLTRLVRNYALYWALADFAAEQDLDMAGCQTLLRRAEFALALTSVHHDRHVAAHGTDKVNALRGQVGPTALAEVGPDSYSPRPWGFWSQYSGPSVVLGTVEIQERALRPGRHPCPAPLRRMFRPLLETIAQQPFPPDEIDSIASLAMEKRGTPDLEPLRDLFTATRAGRHIAEDCTGNDLTRRSTLRLLARCAQLHPRQPWTDSFRTTIAYGHALHTDPVLSLESERAEVWRGTLLRHHSVGAWRRLWAKLVDQVREGCGSATKNDLHAWITSEVPATTVRGFLAKCPPTVDGDGNPLPAEEAVFAEWDEVTADLAILLLGAKRLNQLIGRTGEAFLDRRQRRGQFLDPSWIDYRLGEHEQRPMAELARAFVDDMVAQSRRVALRKLQVAPNGAMTLFTKLRERNGRYFADSAEGSDNVGLRIDQLGFLSEQLALLTPDGVTPLAAELLDLPA